ncbi:hypothetical protein [Carp edema virus]|nr:hypothetical protein [Carp edema virus]
MFSFTKEEIRKISGLQNDRNLKRYPGICDRIFYKTRMTQLDFFVYCKLMVHLAFYDTATELATLLKEYAETGDFIFLHKCNKLSIPAESIRIIAEAKKNGTSLKLRDLAEDDITLKFYWHTIKNIEREYEDPNFFGSLMRMFDQRLVVRCTRLGFLRTLKVSCKANYLDPDSSPTNKFISGVMKLQFFMKRSMNYVKISDCLGSLIFAINSNINVEIENQLKYLGEVFSEKVFLELIFNRNRT